MKTSSLGTIYGIMALLLSWVCLSCSNDDNGTSSHQAAIVSYKVAVVMPADQQDRWSRTVNWALENVRKAQQGLDTIVDIKVEWKDENSSDLNDYLKRVGTDESYVAVVGPLSSSKARQAVAACNSYAKTLILPAISSAELQRICAAKSNVWNLVQSDITQCEILLTQAKLAELKSVSLLTTNDDYGRSYSDWVAYLASEMGLKVDFISIYNNDEELRAYMRQELEQKRNYNRALLFAPSRAEDALVFDREYADMKGDKYYIDFPTVFCSDVVSSSSLATQLKNLYYEGVSPTANPMSGFVTSYQARYGEEPMVGEPQLFDAMLMLAYALVGKQEGETLNEALLRITAGREQWRGSWLPQDMSTAMASLRKGGNPDLEGVLGDWTFDEVTRTNILNTIYSHWILVGGQFKTMEYLSNDGNLHTISTQQAWNWKQQNLQVFDYAAKDYDYPQLNDRWAVVISTSDSWTNYRHEADALAMYQLLKRHGYDDDHIILLMEDFIANDPNNPNPGVVRVRPDGDNLYKDVQVDYYLKNTSLDKFKRVMLGEVSDETPTVIGSSANSNVLVFWCGHGNQNRLAWGSKGLVTGDQVRDIVQQMNEQQKYRKLFFVMDACYSGSIGEACEGIPGLLMMTAANAHETSKADVFDYNLNIWLSNGFTRAFQETIDKNTDINLRELYYELARHTTGSHATVYNAALYGNMYRQTMAEWLE